MSALTRCSFCFAGSRCSRETGHSGPHNYDEAAAAKRFACVPDRASNPEAIASLLEAARDAENGCEWFTAREFQVNDGHDREAAHFLAAPVVDAA